MVSMFTEGAISLCEITIRRKVRKIPWLKARCFFNLQAEVLSSEKGKLNVKSISFCIVF